MKRFVLLGLVALVLAGSPLPVSPLPLMRRVNAPHFTDSVPIDQTGIFWFGQVDANQNYADVRIGYNNTELYVGVLIFDRRLGPNRPGIVWLYLKRALLEMQTILKQE